MSLIDLAERYDSFQKDAVRSIVNDFSVKPNGRYLLVIPTGGGKTITAVKAICKLYQNGVLDQKLDKVLWTAHRNELIKQAEEAFEKIIDDLSIPISIENNIRLEMILSAPRTLQDESVKLAVIDEAHHGAASSYQPLFDCETLGLLGLTATPSRHDGAPLDFEKESYSIGFPDLVKKGIILRPEVRDVSGGRYDFSGFSEDDFEALDNKDRNERIIRHLTKGHEEYQKVIIYVGTKAHAKNLYQAIKDSSLAGRYDSVSYIIGGENSRNQERADFIALEKTYVKSILVNVMVLTEGYDDPKVNTIVMAAPSKSKLYYMQALGRAIRYDPANLLKKAFVVEVVDELPNIRYRIDNRWLYSDVSDVLEPQVRDIEYSKESDFRTALNKIFEDFAVPDEWRDVPEYNEGYRYSVLLFKQYRGPGKYVCFPLVITNENRLKVSNMFNFISERMAHSATFSEYHYETLFRMLGSDGVSLVPENSKQQLIIEAMKNARTMWQDNDVQVSEYVQEGHSWLTFVALHFRRSEEDLPEELLEFTREMINKESMLEAIRDRDYEENSVLIRLPLPLASYIGKIVTNNEFEQINRIVLQLGEVKERNGFEDHRNDVETLIGEAILPVEIRHSSSLLTITREELSYSYPLDGRA